MPLGSDRLGLTAKLDLVAVAGDEAVPVETKRRRAPDVPGRAYDTTRVQLMAQGLLLREHGHACRRGVVYYAASRTRVDVPFTPELESATLDLIDRTRRATSLRQIPDPLEDSPKCNGCSLNGICLPDETLALRDLQALRDADAAEVGAAEAVADDLGSAGGGRPVRRLIPPRDLAQPLYVQEQGAFVGKSKSVLSVKKGGEALGEARLRDVSQLVVCGNVMVGAQTVHLLCEAGVPVVHVSTGGWFYGITQGTGLRNAYDRAAQFDAAARPERCLDFARQLVADKAANQRTMLRRNVPPSRERDRAVADLDHLLRRVPSADSTDALLGLEGAAAAVYFRHFGDMLKPRDFDATAWDFARRNRRPPRDPVNALLSFAYAMLVKECVVALLAEGLDPYWGLYHRPRHGRPAMALDLMEPFRPLVADSAVLSAVNTGMVRASHFTRNADACLLGPAGRKGLIGAYEARLEQLVTHPTFGYRCSWRSVIRVQARLLSRWLRGDVPRFENVVTR